MPHRHHKKIIDVASAIVLLALIALDVALWQQIFVVRGADVSSDSGAGSASAPSIDFLPVAQGESALLVLPGNVTVLTDAGADDGIVDDLQKAMPPGAPAYIDLAIISSPQAADYDGYAYVLQHYAVGAFLYNGRADVAHATEWKQLVAAIAAKHIPLVTIDAGDIVHISENNIATAEIAVLSPDVAFARSPDPVDTGIVQRVITQKFTALLAANIGTNVESALLARVVATGTSTTSAAEGITLRADIFKAPFPGLGTAAGDAFLRAVAPHIIVVMPGAKNPASAPTKAILAHLTLSTAAAIAISKPGVFLLYNK